MSPEVLGVRDDLGERARARRIELGMSQESVAYSLKVEQTTISKIERGAKKPSPEFARRLASVLQLPMDAFLLKRE